MLTDFFRINMPYGIKKNDKGEWMAFNREYKPLGFKTTEQVRDQDYPIHVKYKGLSDALLLKIAHTDGQSVTRAIDGSIERIFLYNDRTNPTNDPSFWPDYFDKLEVLSTLGC